MARAPCPATPVCTGRVFPTLLGKAPVSQSRGRARGAASLASCLQWAQQGYDSASSILRKRS